MQVVASTEAARVVWEAVLECCCGLDVHKQTVIACLLIGALDQQPRELLRTFPTTTKGLLEFRDRFGALPTEVENLLYAVRIKLLATDTGLESVTTEHGEIILRLFEGMRFDKHKLEPLAREGVKISTIQLTLNPKRLGKRWRGVLEEVVGKIT